MFEIRFEGAHYEGTKPPDAYSVLLGVNAELCIRSTEVEVFEEPDFPIVELAAAFVRWLSASPRSVADFNYESIEDDAVQLIWFKRTENGRWSIGSAWSPELVGSASTAELLTACHSFVDDVSLWVSEHLGIKAEAILGRDG